MMKLLNIVLMMLMFFAASAFAQQYTFELKVREGIRVDVSFKNLPENTQIVSVVIPQYPGAFTGKGVYGPVAMQVLINEYGRITFAKAISGHPLLRKLSEKSARLSLLTDTGKKQKGILVYDYIVDPSILCANGDTAKCKQ